MDISVVIPVYKCKESLPELTERLGKVLSNLVKDYEIIYVVDGNFFGEWEMIKKISQGNLHVKGILLSRNFGQHSAIFKGLEYAKGDWIVVMDCDLQDKPEEVEKLYLKALEGYEVVLARRAIRRDGYLKRKFSKLFYRILSYLTETEQDPAVANFGIYHHKVINAILDLGDYVKFLPTMVQWVGFKISKVEVEHNERKYGRSSYNFMKLLRLAVDVILTFSDKPLRLIIYFGCIITIISVFVALYYFYKYITGKIIVIGYSSLIISLWFLFGINFIMLGIVGIYIGKTFNQTKSRPYAIVSQTINFNDNGKN